MDVSGKGIDHLSSFFNGLLCAHRGACDHQLVKLLDVYKCINAECYKTCITDYNPLNCFKRECPLLSEAHDTQKGLQDIVNLRKNDQFDVERSVEEEEDVKHSPVVKRKKTPKDYAEIQKRYRLGLYDCISSYCGELEGEPRKSCIVNYCHRSSTLKMK